MGTAVHGKDHYISVDDIDLTEYVKTSNFEVNPDIHDTTGSGTDDKTYRGGQIGRTFTMGGWYDDDEAAGPAVLEDMAGQTVAFVRRNQGTGVGRPQQACNVVVGKYVESHKNDDILQWTCDFTITGAVTKTTQA